MPRPYSADLRERVLRAWERGEGTPAGVARRFGVCVATVYNWLRDAREEGRRMAKPHAGGSAPLLDAAALQVLRQLVTEPKRCQAGGVHRAPGRAHRPAGEPTGAVPDAQEPEAHAQKKMARPACKWRFDGNGSVCVNVSGVSADSRRQDGDSRAPVLIKDTASDAIF